MPRIAVASPYMNAPTRGNSVSALRIAGILTELGADVFHVAGTAEAHVDADLLIALHARKSGPAIQAFKRTFPNRPVAVVLTGTDLYVDLLHSGPHREAVLRSFAMANALVTYQDRSVLDIPDTFRLKARTIWKSVEGVLPPRRPSSREVGFRVLLASHLRSVKAPLLVIDAFKGMAKTSDVQVVHYGEAEDPELGIRAKAASDSMGMRYTWHGGVRREVLLDILATCHLTINTSILEGGANSLCEALLLGVPCLATAIPANVGILGDKYPGLFPVGDSERLAELLTQAEGDQRFLEELAAASRERAKLFCRAHEVDGWMGLLADLNMDGLL